jgi:uncharacterized membrane protein YkvA (DUF1232 family)
VDLIPDFIPVLGFLDDLLIVPLSLMLVVRLTPPEVIAAAREKAAQAVVQPVSYLAAAIIASLWILFAVWFAYIVMRLA